MITKCRYCQMNVIPKDGNICPSCGQSIFSAARTDMSKVVERPLGVWLLTVSNGIFGISFLIAGYIIFTTGELTNGPGKIIAFLSFLMGFFVIFNSMRAWRGSNWGRFMMVIYVVMGYGFLLFYNFRELQTWSGSDEMWSVSADMSLGLAVAKMFRRILFIALNIWYFLISDRPKEFYSSHAKNILENSHAG